MGTGRWAHVEGRHVALAAAGCAALAVVGLVDPSATRLVPACPLRSLTGLDCPLCGATRATHALLGGDLVGALDHNALYVVLLPLLGALVLVWLVRGRLPAWARSALAVRSLLVAIAGFTVARNLPVDALVVLGSRGANR